MSVCRVAFVSVHEHKKYRQFVQYVSNETSWPSGLFYFFSWIVAEWRVPDLHINFCMFIKIDFTSLFLFMTSIFAMLFL